MGNATPLGITVSFIIAANTFGQKIDEEKLSMQKHTLSIPLAY